jgi:hypothetical protein
MAEPEADFQATYERLAKMIADRVVELGPEAGSAVAALAVTTIMLQASEAGANMHQLAAALRRIAKSVA